MSMNSVAEAKEMGTVWGLGYNRLTKDLYVSATLHRHFTDSAPGTYSLAVDDITGKCPDFSCCPFIVEEDSLPVFQATEVPAGCTGNVAQANGKIVLSGFKPTYSYQYSLGASFNAAASLSDTKRVIPIHGVIASNLANHGAAQAYTVRAYNASGCYTDITVLLLPTSCNCPAAVCVPLVVKQTRRIKRIGD